MTALSPSATEHRELPSLYLRHSAKDWLLAGMTVLLLVPVWSFRYFPSQDGPAHLYGACVLRDLLGGRGALFQYFYELNPRPIPNWFSHAALALLSAPMPPLVAEKLLLTAYVVFFVFALRYALTAFAPSGASVVFLGLPLVYNFYLHLGFFNFSFSLAFALTALGYWRRHRSMSGLHAAALALLLLVLYFCHVVTFVLTWLAISILALARLAKTRRMRPTVRAVAAAVPGLLLMAIYLSQGGERASVGRQPFVYFGLWKLTRLFTLFDGLVAYQIVEMKFTTLLAATYWLAFAALLVAKIRRRNWTSSDALLGVVACWMAAYLLAPPAIGFGTYLFHRISLFPYFGLLLWIGAQRRPPLLDRMLAAIGICLTLILLGLNLKSYNLLNRDLRDFGLARDLVAPGSLILPLDLAPVARVQDPLEAFPSRVDPFIHASGYVAAGRGTVDLSDYEAMSDHFPLRFKPMRDPLGLAEVAQWNPGKLDPAAYEQMTGKKIDAILIWDGAHRLTSDPALAQLRELLASRYEQAPIPEASDRLRLYRRQGP